MAKKEKASTKKEKSSSQWTRKELALWICLTFFACAWMFVLGIFVGRETVPVKFDMEKLENQLAALKEAVIRRERDRYKLDSPSENNKADMEFYDDLKNTAGEEKLKTNTPQNKPKLLPKKTVSNSKKTLVSRKTATTRKKQTAIIEKSAKENKIFTKRFLPSQTNLIQTVINSFDIFYITKEL